MFNLQLVKALFPNGGEAYSYSQLKNWLMNNLGISPRQVAGTIGAGVRYGYIMVATYANKSPLDEAIFVR
ncbi:MAG: hypothetical protein IKU66_06940 [Clostridia bacterium]|nr:hypothetical protein [Clostridia bacterium]